MVQKMTQARFYGVITPFITPFKEDLSIDFEAIRWLARYQAERGVHGIFPNSTTGEFVHLKTEESIKITETVLEEVKDKVWVIPGISSNCTEHCIELGKAFMDLGVDGVIVTPPFFFKVSGKRLKLHFSKIAEKIDLPIIVYNIPSTTGINIPVELYEELASEYSNIAGAKITYDNLGYFRRLINRVKSIRRDFAVLTGIDYLLLPVLMMGGDGGIMALANVAPWIHRAVYDAWVKGDIAKAHEENKKLLKLVEIYDIATSFPTSVKTSLKVLGAPVKPYVRPPLTPEPPENEEKIKKVLEELKIKI